MLEKLPKTMSASTQTFKNRGCYSTNSTHTNEDPGAILFLSHPFFAPVGSKSTSLLSKGYVKDERIFFFLCSICKETSQQIAL